jgi:hypothetical protein
MEILAVHSRNTQKIIFIYSFKFKNEDKKEKHDPFSIQTYFLEEKENQLEENFSSI